MTGSGPAGEITMDDIRQRLQSVTARLAAMRDRDPITAIGGSESNQPGYSDQPDGSRG